MTKRWTRLAVLALCLTAPCAWAAAKHDEGDTRHKQMQPGESMKPAAGPGAPWLLTPGGTVLTFTATQIGQPFTGKFGAVSGTLILDPADLASAKLTASVDLAPIDAGDAQRNAALPGEDWFDVAAHPRASFKSRKFVHQDGHKFQVTGMLSIKGIERQVTIPFSMTPEGDGARIKGSFTINRGDFNVGEGSWATGQWVGLDVTVSINALATRSGT